MDLSLGERGRIDFVLTLRRRWANTLYPALHAQTAADTLHRSDMHGAVQRQPACSWSAFVERNAQKMLWRVVSDVVTAHPASHHDSDAGTAMLELHPELMLAIDEAFLAEGRSALDDSLRRLLRIVTENGDPRGPLRAEAI